MHLQRPKNSASHPSGVVLRLLFVVLSSLLLLSLGCDRLKDRYDERRFFLRLSTEQRDRMSEDVTGEIDYDKKPEYEGDTFILEFAGRW